MNRYTLKSVVVIGLVAFGLNAYADRGTRDPGVNARQHHQTDRIKQGVQSGELTRHEVKGLRDERKDIKQLEQAYKSDGSLSNTERKDLHQELNQLSGDIYQQKHDTQTR